MSDSIVGRAKETTFRNEKPHYQTEPLTALLSSTNQTLAALVYLLGHGQEDATLAASETTHSCPDQHQAQWMCSNMEASCCTGTTAEVTTEKVSASGTCLS